MIKEYSWTKFTLANDTETLQTYSIERGLRLLWQSVFIKLEADQLFLIQFKIVSIDGSNRSISFVQTLTKNDLASAILIFSEFWNLKQENYESLQIKDLLFIYRLIKPNSMISNRGLALSSKSINQKSPPFNIKGYTLPSTMDLTTWGEATFSPDFREAFISKSKSNADYLVKIQDNSLEVDLMADNNVLLSFKDTRKENSHMELGTFIRSLKNQEYHYLDHSLIIKKIKRECSYITGTEPSLFLSHKIITMDLETRTIKGVMSVTTISIYEGGKAWSYYISDYDNSDEMITKAIKSIMIRKYSGFRVYLHNFSNFDGIFILRILSNISTDIKPIIRDNKVIDLKVKFGKYTIFFRDSYLLLPTSLFRLSLNFGVESKSIFPYKFVNDTEIENEYKGPVPSFDRFENITNEEYLCYSKEFENKSWDLRKESIRYCEQDVRSLHQVLSNFSKIIFDLYRLDINKYPTLSSLAFAIFRSDDSLYPKIARIHGVNYRELKKSYTGGAVDVYIPYGKNVVRHDVNSLYPYIMKNFPMPVGDPTFFEGDITQIDKEAFGFFNVEIQAPEGLHVPLLQTRVKTKNGGVRTIAGLGTWKGMYFSEELKEAIKAGYLIKIKSGYLFEKEYIFGNYIDKLYELKAKSERASPMYTISKLLLNSLYGRFGMNPEAEKHIIVDEAHSDEIHSLYKVTDVVNFNNGKELISYLSDKSEEDSKDSKININVAISSAITAYARAYMYRFKTMPGYTLYYSDTDSIDLDKPLPDEFLNDTELGKFKIEHTFKEVVYIAPKVYGGITEYTDVVKVKGLKDPLAFTELKTLLKRDKTLTIRQEKWYRNIEAGHIISKDELYTLISTANKRNMVYDINDSLIGTHPLTLNDGIINES